MIESLRIENLAVLERAELEFDPGLNVLTGETGAGKSIVLGALALLAGGRASQDLIREGADEAVVEAVFRTHRDPDLAARLARLGFEPSDDDELLVRRSVTRSGRGRARLGGELVPVSTLAELFRDRLEISSQHESQELLRPETQSRLLDASGALLPLRGQVAAGVEALRGLDRECAELRGQREEGSRREDFLRFQMNEIDEAAIKPGEISELRTQLGRLANAERLRRDTQQASALLASDPARSEAPGALDSLAEAVRGVEGLAELDAGLEPLAERLRAARTELDDAAQELARYADSVEVDPGRLAAAEERLDQIERLRRKYGVDEDEIAGFRERIAAELAALTGAEDRLGELEAQRARELEQLLAHAGELSRGRQRAGRQLARAAQVQLRELGMPEARFEVALPPLPAPGSLPCGTGGLEAVEFRFGANPGEPLYPLRRVASGGELSRVFLALKCALRRTGAGRVLVFDEVDAGVGGRVADRVGRLLGELAGESQVLCITHLPQIAAGADLHFRVDKRKRARRTVAEVSSLGAEARVEEIARMAGGETVSDATRRHARALLRARR
ncbi:MAG: DNA repair protein RecN [Myxococcota bacterium]